MAFDFASMMNDPQMQYGLALLGAARSSTSPFTDAQKQLFALQKQKEDIALMQSQSQRMQQQTVGERQQNAIALANFLMTRGLANRVQNLKQLGGPGLPPEQVPPATQGLPQPLLDLMGSQGLTSMNTTGATQAALQPQPPPDTGGVNIGNGGQPLAPPPDAGAPMPGGPAVPQSVQPPDVQQTAMPAPQVDQFGTSLQQLANFRQIESRNNPHAIGSMVPGQGRAQGLYQFMPATTKMLNDQGIKFNPLVPGPALDAAASQYWQMLLAQNKGDPIAAANAWQGANKTAGSPANLSYNQRLFQGVPMPGAAPQAPAPQGAPPVTAGPQAAPGAAIPNEGLPLIQAGSMMGLVNPAAGEALIKGGQAMAPTSQTANSYRIGPDGKMIYLPDPEKAQLTANATPDQFGMTPASRATQVNASISDYTKAIEASKEKVWNIPQRVSEINNALVALPQASKFMGPSTEGKLATVKFLNQTFGNFGVNITPEAVTNADVFKSQVVGPLAKSIHETGGRFGPTEQDLLERYFSSMETDPAAAGRILGLVKNSLMAGLNAHNDNASKYADMMTQRKLPFMDQNVKLIAPPSGAPATGGKPPPDVGTVSMGKMFKGGNPADPASWVPVPASK